MSTVALISDLHGGLKGELQQLLNYIDVWEVTHVIQVGDCGIYDYDFPIPFYWIYGNREYVPALKKGIFGKNSFLLKDFEIVDVGGFKVLGINGAEEPKGDGFIQNRGDISFPVPDEPIDILVTHETPIKQLKMSIFNNKLIETHNLKIRNYVETLQPKYAVSGHWHLDMFEMIGNTKCYCLGLEPRHWRILRKDEG